MYEIGQVFVGSYSPDVANWCNMNNAYLVVGKNSDGQKTYTITAVEPYVPTPQETLETYERNIQKRLNDFAAERNYSSIETLVSYANSTNEQFKKEAERGIELRDATYVKYHELVNVTPQTVTPKTKLPAWDVIEKELPELTWGE